MSNRPCAQSPDTWFSDDPIDTELAKLLCQDCPFVVECRAQGQHEEFGVWGGLSPEDRRSLDPDKFNDLIEASREAARLYDETQTIWYRALQRVANGEKPIDVAADWGLSHNALKIRVCRAKASGTMPDSTLIGLSKRAAHRSLGYAPACRQAKQTS